MHDVICVQRIAFSVFSPCSVFSIVVFIHIKWHLPKSFDVAFIRCHKNNAIQCELRRPSVAVLKVLAVVPFLHCCPGSSSECEYYLFRAFSSVQGHSVGAINCSDGMKSVSTMPLFERACQFRSLHPYLPSFRPYLPSPYPMLIGQLVVISGSWSLRRQSN